MTTTRYKMRQRLLSLTDDYYIEDQRGRRIFYVDGKLISLRDTLVFKDMDGQELYKIQEKLLSIRETINILRGGSVVASVRKALVEGLRDRWTVKVSGGPNLKVKGNIFDHDYTILQGRRRAERISKNWFAVRDSYGVEIEDDQDHILILAISVAIDLMAHAGK